MLAAQKSIAEVAKELGVSENTYHRWRNQYGGIARCAAALTGLRCASYRDMDVRGGEFSQSDVRRIPRSAAPAQPG